MDKEERSIDVQRAVSVDLVNDAGSRNMAVDGSVTPVSFKAVPPEGKKWRINRVLVYMEGANPFSAEKFGDLPSLANGTTNNLNGVKVTSWKTNRDFALEMYDLNTIKSLGKDDRSFSGRWSFDKAFGKPVLIDSSSTGVELIVNDNLSGLTSFYVKAQGQEV